MQFLVQTSDAPGTDWNGREALLRDEARAAYAHWQAGRIRQLWFTEAQDAVLLLECTDLGTARELVETLPLVKARLLQYTLTPLVPYPGFERLMKA